MTKTVENQYEKTEDLNNFLAEVVNTQDSNCLRALHSCSMEGGFRFRHITEYETTAALQRVKKKKAPGHDKLTSLLLWLLSTAIVPNVIMMYNSYIDSCEFPAVWKMANIKAIWKGKRKKNDASNYRPISVLPLLARIFEKLLANQLNKHCEGNQVMPNTQFGFRSHSSCEMALI